MFGCPLASGMSLPLKGRLLLTPEPCIQHQFCASGNWTFHGPCHVPSLQGRFLFSEVSFGLSYTLLACTLLTLRPAYRANSALLGNWTFSRSLSCPQSARPVTCVVESRVGFPHTPSPFAYIWALVIGHTESDLVGCVCMLLC